jgi:hypothetical protein
MEISYLVKPYRVRHFVEGKLECNETFYSLPDAVYYSKRISGNSIPGLTIEVYENKKWTLIDRYGEYK